MNRKLLKATLEQLRVAEAALSYQKHDCGMDYLNDRLGSAVDKVSDAIMNIEHVLQE